MKHLDLTFDTPAENLACDETLLDWCEDGIKHELLRFWEPARHFVVVGYANKISTEVNAPACESLGIPILRRCSGGGTVVQGPGCLNYSLILRVDESGPTAGIRETNCLVMQAHARALESVVSEPVQIQGHTDLTMGNVKFSGNAQRRKRRCLLFHGSFLLNFDLPLIEKVLHIPSHQPDYRLNRPHQTFLRNLNVPATRVREALRSAWQANDDLEKTPLPEIAKLAAEKYAVREWNYKFE